MNLLQIPYGRMSVCLTQVHSAVGAYRTHRLGVYDDHITRTSQDTVSDSINTDHTPLGATCCF